MSGVTTVTISEETRERIEDHRHDSHHSVEDVLNGMMDALPTTEQLVEGCCHCGKEHLGNSIEEEGGCVVVTPLPDWGQVNVTYFCSPSCAGEFQEDLRRQFPEEPDLVVVGGKDELRCRFEGARYYIDGETEEIAIEVPGAFTGSEDHSGRDYDYVGEPVYLKNNEEWVQSAIVNDIYHEDAATILDLGGDWQVEGKHHPDEEERHETLGKIRRRRDIECPGCGEMFEVDPINSPIECPFCDEEIEVEMPEELTVDSTDNNDVSIQ